MMMQKENKMGIMPVPKLVVSMSFPIMVSMLLLSRCFGINYVWYAFWISEITAVIYAVLRLNSYIKN